VKQGEIPKKAIPPVLLVFAALMLSVVFIPLKIDFFPQTKLLLVLIPLFVVIFVALITSIGLFIFNIKECIAGCKSNRRTNDQSWAQVTGGWGAIAIGAIALLITFLVLLIIRIDDHNPEISFFYIFTPIWLMAIGFGLCMIGVSFGGAVQ
jgi:hypothetical protein